MEIQDTFVALSTPHGESALGVIRCSGPLCPNLVKDIFGNKSPTPRRTYVSDYHSETGEFLDNVVYTFYENEKSYTGDSMLELSCHGNPFILQHILEDLVTRGCRHAQPGEFTQSAFLNGKMDLSQAEAVIDLIKARTDLSFKAASNQLQGSLSRRINGIVENLLQIIAEIEAYIDFPEEDLPTDGESSPISRLKNLSDEISELSETARTGIFLREGVKTIIIGAPNAGKSSLLNQLLGESRAIVSNQPGTTRDYIEASFYVDPYRINILDTAGVHSTENEIEKAGIAKTLEQIELSDLILLTIDASESPPLFPDSVLSLLKLDNTILVHNKSDLEFCPKSKAYLPEFQRIEISALTGAGISDLKVKIKDLLGNPIVSEQGDVVAVSARHHTALLEGSKELMSSIDLLNLDEPAELVASHLRDAMGSLERIVGRIDNERMLDKLFSSFCIGK
ncbi:MAG: tRNA uridine-5-carboxymethylaminomethyl(34) synthesis GTPase MnmE [Verrucomicrobia bacterium]|nr:tRNA uridine-5-carboxymethylaminomethyl(34) synthesis GTPase MnmE [Verrucomicrobiota bacterium]MDA1065866.1 tRNA uridine-5-carboxymethylaminomethyl(34) synthesis GTPase MnmE [Verrucomicrobiota bacterium]